MSNIAEVNLTKRQRASLAAVRAFVREHGYPPTHRQLCELLGTTSTNWVRELLHALTRRDLLAKTPMRHGRAITLAVPDRPTLIQPEHCDRCGRVFFGAHNCPRRRMPGIDISLVGR